METYAARPPPASPIAADSLQVAAGRLLSLLNADAHVHLVAPLAGCSAEVLHRIRTVGAPALVHHNTHFTPALLARVAPTLVLTAVDSPAVSTEIYQLCHAARIPVNVADVPPECDFYFGSIHRDGPLQVMVSTNGNGPKLANIVRRQIAQGLPENLGEAITRVGVLRKRLRRIATGQDEGPRRMEWMSRVCEEWTLEELCEMGEDEMVALLAGYREGKVITLREIRGEEEDGAPEWVSEVDVDEREEDRASSSEEDNSGREVFEEAFDGSFGFCF